MSKKYGFWCCLMVIALLFLYKSWACGSKSGKTTSDILAQDNTGNNLIGDATVQDHIDDAGNHCPCQVECSQRTWSCNASVGLIQPLPVCSPSNPCQCVSKEFEQNCICQITEPSVPPTCRTGALGLNRGRINANDGPPLSRIDEDGITRYACLFRPPDASPNKKYPLVVWLHGGGQGSADDVYNTTSLREKADPTQNAAFDLRGNGQPGFLLLAIQGRRLHYPTDYPRDGQHHDFYHRDLGQPSSNRDIANVDAWIDTIVAQGAVDTKRIYLMGWSNGCFFAQLYAFARHERKTPGGHRPAAVACYSGADPFANINLTQQPSCQLTPYPTTTVPILLVGRNCDLPPCNQTQADAFLQQGIDIQPGHIAEPWVNLCQSQIARGMERLILDATSGITSQCLDPAYCTYNKALLNHIRWPDGKASLDVVDREPNMLRFLRDHPLL